MRRFKEGNRYLRVRNVSKLEDSRLVWEVFYYLQCETKLEVQLRRVVLSDTAVMTTSELYVPPRSGYRTGTAFTAVPVRKPTALAVGG
jgi:hypothetical protein